MKCVLLHQTITSHDAIGNDIAHMYKILGRKHDVFVYCNNPLSKALRSVNRNALMELINDKNNLIIYHHSNYWEEGEEILDCAKAKVIVKYHCLTPPAFFKNWSADYYWACKNGCDQTRVLFEKHNEFLWMGDSFYNLSDAGIAEKTNTIVVPPFNNLEQWRNVVPDEGIMKSLLESPAINLLFVGRVAPNKGHLMLVDIVKDYVSYYDENIALYIIGKKDNGLNTYAKEIDNLIEGYGLTDHVNWVEEVNDSRLLSYYLGCDFYLNCSDHEGFCVPIIEAQSLCLPVIAKRAAAVPETIGKEQIVLENDIAEYSAAIHILSKNDLYRNYLVKMGLNNYQERFANPIIEKKFIEAVQNFTGENL